MGQNPIRLVRVKIPATVMPIIATVPEMRLVKYNAAMSNAIAIRTTLSIPPMFFFIRLRFKLIGLKHSSQSKLPKSYSYVCNKCYQTHKISILFLPNLTWFFSSSTLNNLLITSLDVLNSSAIS